MLSAAPGEHVSAGSGGESAGSEACGTEWVLAVHYERKPARRGIPDRRPCKKEGGTSHAYELDRPLSYHSASKMPLDDRAFAVAAIVGRIYVFGCQFLKD